MSYNNRVGSEQLFPAPQSDSSTIFFPHWFECPYRFHVRLVWAVLMDSARRRQVLTAQRIVALTGLSDNTIRLAIHTLVKDNLCTIQKGKRRITRIDLIEPADDARYWASKKGEGWLNQIAYTVVAFTPGMSAIQSVLLAKAATLKGKQSYRGLSEMLGLWKGTVRNAMSALITLGTITLAQLPDGYFTIDIADSDPSIKAVKGKKPPVNNCASSSAAQDVAEVFPKEECPATKMSQMSHQDVADSSRDVADCSRDVADSDPSIKGITGTIKVAQKKSAFLGELAEDAAQGMPVGTRRPTEKDYDPAYAKHLQRLGCDVRAIPRILALWKEKMHRLEFPEGHCLILDYSPNYLAEKRVANPSGFIIAELKEQLGIAKRKPLVQGPKKQLTEEQLEYRRMWQQHYADERETASLCLDMSIPFQR